MFPDAALSPLATFDLAALAALTFVLPVYAVVEHLQDRRRRTQGRPRTRMQMYRHGFVLLWVMTIAMLAVWLVANRSLAELGLRAPSSAFFIGGAVLAIVAATALAAQVVIVRRSAKAQAYLERQLAAQPRVAEVVPETSAELQAFRLLSLSAGICEEIIFRGFMIWGFAHWMHPALAAALSLAIFVFVHLYQESPGALLRVGLTGLVFTLLTMFSGSLLPAILVHAAIDLSSGEVSYIVMRKKQLAPA
jgi:uncharacterized protein